VSGKANTIGMLTIVAAALLSACGPVAYPPTPAPGYGYGPGGMMEGGGMMGGGNRYQAGTPAPGYDTGPGGMMGSGHMGGVPGGMMGGSGYGVNAPTAEPTPIGATPVAVDEEIQIMAANVRFAPTRITVKPGEAVRFTIANDDAVPHNFVSAEAGIPYLALPGGTTQTLTWTAPKAEGTYTAVCTFHPGMSLSINIEA
jgi:plastocyanin